MSLADRLSGRAPASPAVPSVPIASSETLRGRVGSQQPDSEKDRIVALKSRVHDVLLETLGPKLYDDEHTQGELEQQVRKTLQSVLGQEDTPLTAQERSRIAQEIADEILGYGPLEPYLRDADITEIMVNRADSVYIERAGQLHEVETAFVDEAHLRRTIDKIVARVGRRVDESSPMVDARLPDGSRVNAVVAPVALDGAMLTVRKFAKDPYTSSDLIAFGTMNREVFEFLDACVRGRLNVLVSGGTGSGKTTMLNVLSSSVPDNERIVTIEDAAELQLHQRHVLRMETRPPNIEGRGQIAIRDLVRNALRMRPDRIIVGEVRDAAALDMLQAMNTGHDGGLTTVHANSPRDALSRLETMTLMAGFELPVRAIREQVASALDLIVHTQRLKDGTRRITHVTEVVAMEGDIVTLQDLFMFDFKMGVDAGGRHVGHLKSTGIRPQFAEELFARGITLPDGIFTFEG